MKQQRKPDGVVSGVNLPAPAPALYTITYEWGDGLTLRLSTEHVRLIHAFARDGAHGEKCLRFLAELPNPPSPPPVLAKAKQEKNNAKP